MANYVSNAALNIAVNELSGRTISVKAHDGAPGNNGANNQVSGAEVDHSSAQWTPGSAGVSETTVDTEFGVLDANAETTVRAYSTWDGATFLGWADLVADIIVGAGESFSIDAGTVEFRFSR